MPPKSKGRLKGTSYENSGVEEESDDYASRDSVREPKEKGKGAATASVPVTKRTRRNKANPSKAAVVPEIFQDMLAETLSSTSFDTAERPRKRRRVRQAADEHLPRLGLNVNESQGEHEDDESLEFEDVIPAKQEQTAFRESDDGSSESDFAWEDTGLTDYTLKSRDNENDDGDLHLTLATESTSPRRTSVAKRKALNKAEKAVRLEVHKLHTLCLLSFVDRRNKWCNDDEVQKCLKHLLSKQMFECFKPKDSYSQFGKAESVKKGLVLAVTMWESKFNVIFRSLRRSFWAENEQDIKNFKLPPDADPLKEKNEFRAAAKKLEGSRDVGTQLFCALLRGAGLEVRLVCSLQPLPCSPTAKGSALNVSNISATESIVTPDMTAEDEEHEAAANRQPPSRNEIFSNPGMTFAARRRLGHPNAADYFVPLIRSSPQASPKPKKKWIRESPFPVFWVEVLDEAHQKWMAVNPTDPTSVNNPRKFEPPASDNENNMSYVIAFDDDGAARDVTYRYAKSFNSKTRKNRVECTIGGERWWRRTMRFYSRGWKSDLEQIEDTELAAMEAREPMPKSVADFKDHPVYALERHLRRNEVLVSPKEVGKVAAGRDSNGKRLERVYRRSDVRPVKSADSWYRIGREIKFGEQPLKIVAPRRLRDNMEEIEETAGTGLFAESQTEPYQAPPVVNGRVPKNSYGNLDIYVPSMVPSGGVHLPYHDACRAARLLGVDYADAVTGFEFRGRHGTAVVRGIVAAAEYQEAIEAIIEGFRDEEAEAEEERRSLMALRIWKRFLVGLRIKERVAGYAMEEDGGSKEEHMEHVEEELGEEDSGMDSEEYIDDGGGGFFPE